MRRSHQFAAVTAAAITLATGLPTSAAAETTRASSPAGDGTGVIATYNGERIDLADGWDGATVCAEFGPSDVRCFDDDAAYREATGLGPAHSEIGTRDLYDCPAGWVCIWDNRAYAGRRLQWSAPGTKNLADWDFRDRANSAANRRVQYGAALIDVRTLQPDRTLLVGAGVGLGDLGALSYPGGGNWNNKADRVEIY
ncbi:peptidase inhibitor family I36 protein [Marinactinospora rubrisoli]|uniref:Peptidase inhibitor family I36 protein n=1 Tax=Marinactinospora rubrisoli TaxID=2715399 RepID=A0ABW2KCR7_9ACTN